MKFKGLAIPAPTKGITRNWISEVVPDQSLSLKEILQRFTRREALPVGHNHSYGSHGAIDPESDSEFNIDQEKAKHWDITEKMEFAEKVKAQQAEYDQKEQAKAKKQAEAKAEADKKAFEERVQSEARKVAEQNRPQGGSI